MQIKLTLIRLIYSKYACNHHVCFIWNFYNIFDCMRCYFAEGVEVGGFCVHTYINFAFPLIDKK